MRKSGVSSDAKRRQLTLYVVQLRERSHMIYPTQLPHYMSV
jgi:hypothetical protein